MGTKKIVGNYILSVINTAISLLFPIITFPYVSRVLGASNLGIINFAQSYGYYFIHIANFGISSYAVREISKIRDDKEILTRKTNEIFNINLFFSVASWLLYMVGVLTVPRLRENIIPLFVYSIIVISNFLSIEWLLQSFDDYFFSTIRSTIIRLISLAAVFILIKKQDDYIIYMGITVVSEMGARLSTVKYSRRKYVRLALSRKFLNFGQHIKPLFTLFSFRIVNGISSQLDKLMIGFMLLYSDVGIYSAGVKIALMIAPIIENVGIVMFPTMNIAAKNSKEKYLENLKINYDIILLMGIPMCVGLFLISPMTIKIFAGNEYLEAVKISRIMSIIVLLNPVGDMLGSKILLIYDRNKDLLICSIIVALSNIILNFLFIPAWGIAGAAIASVISCFLAIIARFYYCSKIVNFNLLNQALFKYALLTIPFAILYYVFKHWIDNNIFCYVAFIGTSVAIYIFELCLVKDKYVMRILHKLKKDE